MLWTSDQFNPPHNYDFRMKFIYEELRNKNIKFVEFIRSMEPSLTVLRHVLKRKRPVVYSYAIVKLAYYFADIFGKKEKKELNQLFPPPTAETEQCFWYTVATNYLIKFNNDIWAIKVLKFVLKFIGIKASYISVAVSRNFHEVLACKLLGIKVVGIQHGASLKSYSASDFVSEFDGEKSLGVDKYGLWSEWWREYHIKNSRLHKPEQLYVSGPMRPLEHKNVSLRSPSQKGGLIKVLFVSEQLAAPLEVMPYLQALISAENISLYLKFRPYRDGFEDWLLVNHSNVLGKLGKEQILRGSMPEAIALSDVVVGSNSTGVLESVLQLKPFVFFRTNKWGDYFELKSFDPSYNFYAESPEELIDCVRQSQVIPPNILKKLQKRFFGNPYQNGSKWVVEQMEKFLRS